MATGTQKVEVEFRLIDNDTGKLIDREVSEIPEMSPEAASRLQMDLMAARLAMHKDWHTKKFG